MKLNVNTKFIGKNCIYYKTIDSTQLEIWRLAKTNIPTGTIVIADLQTSGIGTHGRVWHTDEENNIAFSLYLKLSCNIDVLEGITVEIANIIVELFKDMYKIELSIKSPNDIVYNNKKIGGILTETKVLEKKVTDCVIGIGINTSQVEFCDELKDIASSIKKEFAIDIDTYNFIEEFCNKFEKNLLNRLERN